MTKHEGLTELVAKLSELKSDETRAKEGRIDVEEQIIALLEFDKQEGQTVYNGEHGNGSTCSVTLKQPITTSVDSELWEKLRRTLDPKHPARAIFNRKYSIDTKAARALQEGDYKSWCDASGVITRRPGKVSVTIKNLAVKGVF